jgi:hypothetical protein
LLSQEKNSKYLEELVKGAVVDGLGEVEPDVKTGIEVVEAAKEVATPVVPRVVLTVVEAVVAQELFPLQTPHKSGFAVPLQVPVQSYRCEPLQ